MTADDLVAALRAAGFDGVEHDGGTLFARTHASAAEFQITGDGGRWTATFAHPVRAPGSDLVAWNALCPHASLDIHRGETRLSMQLNRPDDLSEWRRVLLAMMARSLDWRRIQRQKDEGM